MTKTHPGSLPRAGAVRDRRVYVRRNDAAAGQQAGHSARGRPGLEGRCVGVQTITAGT